AAALRPTRVRSTDPLALRLRRIPWPPSRTGSHRTGPPVREAAELAMTQHLPAGADATRPRTGAPRQVWPGGARLLKRVGSGRAVLPSRRPSGGERPQHVLQDAAVAEVLRLTGGVDTDDRVELHGGAVLLGGGDRDRLRDRSVVQRGDAGEREGLRAVQAQRLGVLALGELQGQHAHADEVRAVDALEALGDDDLDAEELGALGRPVAGGPGAVLLAGEDD